MSKIEWREPMREELRIYNDEVAELIAVGEGDEAVVLLTLGRMDEHVVTVEVLRTDGTSVSTRSTQQWPDVEEVLPRSEWPREVYAGKNVEHEAVPELRAMLDAVIARDLAEIAALEAEDAE